jgi:hypothetical protein
VVHAGPKVATYWTPPVDNTMVRTRALSYVRPYHVYDVSVRKRVRKRVGKRVNVLTECTGMALPGTGGMVLVFHIALLPIQKRPVLPSSQSSTAKIALRLFPFWGNNER